MKKIIIFTLLLSLVIPWGIKAETLPVLSSRIYNLVGTVQSINESEKSFELKLGGLAVTLRGFFASVLSVFNKKYTPVVYKILTDENTTFTKKELGNRIVPANFSDLKTGLRVQVKGTLSFPANDQYRGTILAKNVFILTPFPATSTTTPSVTYAFGLRLSCFEDNHCVFCGYRCLHKDETLLEKNCPSPYYLSDSEGKSSGLACFNGNALKCICSNYICRTVGIVGMDNQCPPANCKEVKCEAIGTRSEGWYACGFRLKYDQCNGCRAICKYQGTNQEGWYNSCNNSLIWLERCSQVVTTTTTPNPTAITSQTPIVAPECQTDNDCMWCGNSCLAKKRIPIGDHCPQVMPPEGASCKCENGKCKIIKGSSDEKIQNREILNLDCQTACKRMGYQNGVCRSWGVVPNVQSGCNSNEVSIGYTKDCNLIGPDGKLLVGVGKACCCSNPLPSNIIPQAR